MRQMALLRIMIRPSMPSSPATMYALSVSELSMNSQECASGREAKQVSNAPLKSTANDLVSHRMSARFHTCAHSFDCTLGRADPHVSRCTLNPFLMSRRRNGANVRLASVDSNAKSRRAAASSEMWRSMILPAANAWRSESSPESPRAIVSAFTNSIRSHTVGHAQNWH